MLDTRHDTRICNTWMLTDQFFLCSSRPEHLCHRVSMADSVSSKHKVYGSTTQVMMPLLPLRTAQQSACYYISAQDLSEFLPMSMTDCEIVHLLRTEWLIRCRQDAVCTAMRLSFVGTTLQLKIHRRSFVQYRVSHPTSMANMLPTVDVS
jgi:hypothetical protein